MRRAPPHTGSPNHKLKHLIHRVDCFAAALKDANGNYSQMLAQLSHFITTVFFRYYVLRLQFAADCGL